MSKTYHNEKIVFELENHLIKFEKWEDILDNFPADVKAEAEYIIRWDRGEEKHMPHPLGLGYREDVGWFALASGQGPFIVWCEKEI